MQKYGSYDIVVSGGGPAGIGAALAAAKNGAKVLIVEQYAFLGGCATFGMPLLVFHTLKGEKIIEGVAQEFVDELLKIDGVTNHVPLPAGHISTYTLMDSEAVKYIAQKMLVEAGVEILFHSQVVDAVMDKGAVRLDQGAVRGVVIQNKQGRFEAEAKNIIDGTGDADVAFKAGVEVKKGSETTHKMQALTMNFRLGGVDLEKLTQWIDQDPVYAVKPGESKKTFLRGWGTFGRWEDLIQQMGLFRDRDHQIYVNSFRDGEINCNTVKVMDLDPTDVKQLTRAEIETRDQVWQVYHFMKKRCPGCADSYLLSTPVMVGIRETRRILGEYELKTEDVLEGRKFPDVIARASYTVDIHDPATGRISYRYVGGDGSYDIPYRSLVPKKVNGILAGGRCLSASQEALGSARVMAICMATGEAAGTAAAMAIDEGCEVRDLDVKKLQKRLVEQKANLG